MSRRRPRKGRSARGTRAGRRRAPSWAPDGGIRTRNSDVALRSQRPTAAAEQCGVARPPVSVLVTLVLRSTDGAAPAAPVQGAAGAAPRSEAPSGAEPRAKTERSKLGAATGQKRAQRARWRPKGGPSLWRRIVASGVGRPRAARSGREDHRTTDSMEEPPTAATMSEFREGGFSRPPLREGEDPELSRPL